MLLLLQLESSCFYSTLSFGYTFREIALVLLGDWTSPMLLCEA